MSKEKWVLVQSFHIDNGELDGQSPQQCFALGYEFACVDKALETGDSFEMTVRCENRPRIEEVLTDRRRWFRWTWMNDDVSEEWIHLTVQPTSREGEQP